MAAPVALSLLVGLAVGLAAVPPLRLLARRLDITDRPDALLKPHARPTPYLGGLAIALGWLAGLAVVSVARPGDVAPQTWLVVALAGPVLAVGLLDDIRGLGPGWRVVVEVAAAVGLWLGGVRFLAVPGLDPGGWAVWLVGLPLQVALVLGACNAVNLLDGLDGLCGGVLAIGLAALAALAGTVLLRGGADPGGRLATVVLLAPPLVGALLGFLVFNYRPASIFMGDAGSLLLGWAVACCGALLAGPGWDGLHLALSGLVIVALPVGDTGLAFYRRIRSGRPLFQGDRSHFYDQLVDRGFSIRGAVNLCYAISAAFAAIGWVGGALLPLRWALPLYAATAVAAILALSRLGFARPSSPGDEQTQSTE